MAAVPVSAEYKWHLLLATWIFKKAMFLGICVHFEIIFLVYIMANMFLQTLAKYWER